MKDSCITIAENVIKTDNGRLSIYQCRPKITTTHPISQHICDFNARTCGDITNKRKQRKDLLNMVLRRTL